MESIDRLRKDADGCTQMDGVDETVWITKAALLKDIDAIEQEVEEGYIELPRDANGEPIRVGDVMYPPRDCDDYVPLRVVRLTYDGYEDEWFFDGEAGDSCGMDGTHMDVAGWTHHKPPTVEEVLQEFASKRIRLFFTMPMGISDKEIKEYQERNDKACDELIEEFAAKLKLREAE